MSEDGLILLMMVIFLFGAPTTGVVMLFIGRPIGQMLQQRAARRHERRMKRLDIAAERAREGKPVCQSCGHGYGYHCEDGCTRTVEYPTQWNSGGIPVHFGREQCECLEYTGPVPGVTGTALRELGGHA